eukprot:TRINITY_DN1863_c0_g1_i3.p2 TRINITY_DN1863_c0_g1~~TRINITY_DN1863_c0_g1_i3.p2  ORF type:complete len:117 (+),score=42.85 TRINITY_DN1863_c0_g1_i3:118-468(+)
MVAAELRKAKNKVAQEGCTKDRRVIEAKSRLKALLEKKYDLIQAEDYQGLARLQQDVDAVTAALQEMGVEPEVRLDRPGAEEDAVDESGDNRELHEYKRMRREEGGSGNSGSCCVL